MRTFHLHRVVDETGVSGTGISKQGLALLERIEALKVLAVAVRAYYRQHPGDHLVRAGKVAQGVVFDDGSCALRWLTEHKSTAVYDNLETVERVHGGRTQIVEDIEAPSDAWRELRAAAGEVSTDAAADAYEEPFRGPENPQNERPTYARINPEVLKRLGRAILALDAAR